MIVRANHQSDFFDLAAHDGGLTLPPELARIDELLEASDLGARVEEEMRKRWPKNPQRGRRSLPAECYLRLLVLKHYKDWSYRELVEEVKWNIAYRRFCRLGGQKMPHYSAVARIGQLLHGEVVAELNRQQVTGAVEEKLVAGRKMRVDTTVVESNIHYASEGAGHARLQSRQDAKASQEIDACRHYALSAHFVQWPGTLLDDNYDNTSSGQGNGGGEAYRCTSDHKDSRCAQLSCLSCDRYPPGQTLLWPEL